MIATALNRWIYAEAFEARLEQMGERYEKRVVPGFGIVQINIWDPDGNHIHIDFQPGDA